MRSAGPALEAAPGPAGHRWPSPRSPAPARHPVLASNVGLRRSGAVPPVPPRRHRRTRSAAGPRTPTRRHRPATRAAPPPPADPNAPPPPRARGPERPCRPTRRRRLRPIPTRRPRTPMRRRRPARSRAGSTTPRAASATWCPAGWVVGDASKLNYGQALLTKETGPAADGPARADRHRHQRPARPARPEAVRRRRAGQRQGRGPVGLRHGRVLHAVPRHPDQPADRARCNAGGHDRRVVVLRGEVHRHHQAQRSDLGRRGRQRRTRTRRAVSATSAGSWSGWVPARTRSTPTPPRRWPSRSGRGHRRRRRRRGRIRTRRPHRGSERAAAARPGRAPVGVPVPVETPVPEMMPPG